jgi:hypothetical protein
MNEGRGPKNQFLSPFLFSGFFQRNPTAHRRIK